MKKILLPGLVAGVVMLIMSMVVSQVFSFGFPGLQAEYNNTNIFRPWSDPLMQIFYTAPFVLGIILAYIWSKVKKLFKGSMWKRALCFGCKYWLITLPGMILTYSSFQLSLLIIISWSVSMFVQGVAAGLVFVKFNK